MQFIENNTKLESVDKFCAFVRFLRCKFVWKSGDFLCLYNIYLFKPGIQNYLQLSEYRWYSEDW